MTEQAGWCRTCWEIQIVGSHDAAHMVSSRKRFCRLRPGPEVIKLFSCSTQLRLKFILLINVKMPTVVGILTFMSRINY